MQQTWISRTAQGSRVECLLIHNLIFITDRNIKSFTGWYIHFITKNYIRIDKTKIQIQKYIY